MCGHLNVLNAQLVALAAEALESGVWEGRGVRSLQHWLCWKAGISSGHAGEVVRLAAARVSHPLIMETFAEGLLSVDQVAIATKAPVHLDDWFATVAQSATVAQLRTMVRAAPPRPWSRTRRWSRRRETVAGWFDDDGRYRLRGELDPDHGRIVDQALTEARRRCSRPASPTSRGPTRWWRWPNAPWMGCQRWREGSGSGPIQPGRMSRWPRQLPDRRPGDRHCSGQSPRAATLCCWQCAPPGFWCQEQAWSGHLTRWRFPAGPQPVIDLQCLPAGVGRMTSAAQQGDALQQIGRNKRAAHDASSTMASDSSMAHKCCAFWSR